MFLIRKVYATKEEFDKQNKELAVNLPYAENTEILGKEYNLENKVIPNRLACQAMEGCDGTADGSPDTLTKRRYERLAKGGAGIIWFEATAVMEEARANPRQLYINENNLDSFKKQVEEIKETALKTNGYEPVVIMQATHSGRYSKPNGTPAPLIAYNNPIFEKDNPISADRIVTDEYLDRVGEALVKGSALAEKAGFDGVDIKCCHRYLNSELLSAFNREGRYGGSLENRTRLLRQSVKGAIDTCSKDFIVSSRLNVYDGFPHPYGFGVDNKGGLDYKSKEPVWLIKELYNMGVRLLNITMGNPYFNPHVNRPFAKGAYEIEEHPLEGVKRVLGGIAEVKSQVPQMAIISSALSYLGVAAPNVAAAYIKDEKFDFAGFGRTIFAYPDFATDILKSGSMDKNKICICCSKCTEIMRSPGGTPGCVIRDKEVYLPIYNNYFKK
ncbi:MAG: flavin oxidoreductase/NADH oxidase [Clostridia bacterium]|nr:flavin oxidoreductase/NADH oxidase [Clostridia bacterium]